MNTPEMSVDEWKKFLLVIAWAELNLRAEIERYEEILRRKPQGTARMRRNRCLDIIQYLNLFAGSITAYLDALTEDDAQ